MHIRAGRTHVNTAGVDATEQLAAVESCVVAMRR